MDECDVTAENVDEVLKAIIIFIHENKGGDITRLILDDMKLMTYALDVNCDCQ